MSNASTARGVVHGLLIGHAEFGGSWHGPSVQMLLQGISAETAAARPVAGTKTIWEYLLHINVWQQTVRQIISTGIHVPEEAVESWPTVPDTGEEAWQQCLDAYRASANALVEAVRGLSEEDLNRPVEGAPFPLKVVVHGIAHHSLYHAAQIAILRKAIPD